MDSMSAGRRTFVKGALCMAATGLAGTVPATGKKDSASAGCQGDALDTWQRETELVSPDVYDAYMRDGGTRGLVSLDKLEQAFDKVFREVGETCVGDSPAVWSIYNMG